MTPDDPTSPEGAEAGADSGGTAAGSAAGGEPQDARVPTEAAVSSPSAEASDGEIVAEAEAEVEDEPELEEDDDGEDGEDEDDEGDDDDEDDDEDLDAAGATAAPAPARARRGRRGGWDPALPPPVVRAQAKYVRSSARKARLVCDNIRGKSVQEARAILALTPRAIARDWSKLLESAVANAEHNHELIGEDLYVMAIHADEGPTIKRFRPRAMGRATKIRKRTSHLTILLTPKD